ncbi:methyltransferase domain-containing protein [Paenibacillus thiaminolyticus]|nr:methyltransferase domain-containing protein [Paenibacillus thiaminolyticus]
MAITRCGCCQFMYDEWYGDTRNGVPAGTPLEELAGTLCSRCGMQGNRHEWQPSPKYAGQEAEYYDQFAGKAGIAFYRHWLEQAAEPPSVLELGVGTGRLAVELASRAGRYCGVDWSPQMLKAADTKRKRMFKEEAEQRLQLAEEDVLTFEAPADYTHVLCPDGFLQHFTRMEEHLALLRKIHRWLQARGSIAVDLILPPGGAAWQTLERKRVQPHKLVRRQIDGSTSLSRQIFHCAIAYETYIDGTMESRYLAEREYALMTPKEAVLLLAAEGFEVTRIIQNYGLSTPWRTVLPPGLNDRGSGPDASETIDEAIAAGKCVQPYRENEWQDSGYPLRGALTALSPDASATMTLIARKK